MHCSICSRAHAYFSPPQSNNPNVIIPSSPSIYELLTSAIIPLSQSTLPTSLLSQFIQPRNYPLDLEPSLPTHLDAPIVESNFDSNTKSDVEHITLHDKTH